MLRGTLKGEAWSTNLVFSSGWEKASRWYRWRRSLDQKVRVLKIWENPPQQFLVRLPGCYRVWKVQGRLIKGAFESSWWQSSPAWRWSSLVGGLEEERDSRDDSRDTRWLPSSPADSRDIYHWKNPRLSANPKDACPRRNPSSCSNTGLWWSSWCPSRDSSTRASKSKAEAEDKSRVVSSG